MADVHTPEVRSYNMSQIKGKNTKPEEKVRKYLFAHGFRYRKNDKRLMGSPDIVLPKYHAVVFINGCFWHKHENCKYFVWPKSNIDLWREKIYKNVERDQKQQKELEALGWKVFVIWECEIKHHFEETMKDLTESLLAEKVFK